MAYSNQIPRATDQLDDSQKDLLNNFIAIQNLIGINHVNFNNAAETGKHSQVTFPAIPNPITPAPTPTIALEANMYSQVSANTGFTEIVWQRAVNQPVPGPGQIIEMTAGRFNDGVVPPNRDGWSKFPSGLLIKWGIATVNANPTVVAYPLAIGNPPVVPPIFSAVFCVFTQAIKAGSPTTSVTLESGFPLNVADFTVRSASTSGLPVSFYYLAIGI